MGYANDEYTPVETKYGTVYAKATDNNHVFVSTYPHGTNTADKPLMRRGKVHHISAHIYLEEKENRSSVYFAGMFNGKLEPSSTCKNDILSVCKDAILQWVNTNPEVLRSAQKEATQRSIHSVEEEIARLESELKKQRLNLEELQAKYNNL